MLIRIQQDSNVDAWVNHDEATGGLGDRVQPQDVFVVHTRFGKPGLSPDDQLAEFPILVKRLRDAFPCNRIVALNGLSTNPLAPRYVYALAETNPWAVILDWEAEDWFKARHSGARLKRWTYGRKRAAHRIGVWIGSLSGALAGSAPATRAGIAPVDQPGWDYGAIARRVDGANRRLGDRHLGPISMQTQTACMTGAKAFGHRTKLLFRQLRTRAVKRKRRSGGRVRKVTVRRKLRRGRRPSTRNVALQVSFSATPRRKAPLPIDNVAPATADRCVGTGLAHGAGAFFFYASDESMRVLFQQRLMSVLRPPAG